MACPEFDDLVKGAAAAAAHAEHCDDCRALLEAWADAGEIMEMGFRGITAPPSLAAGARIRIERVRQMRPPSLIPEILDFVGWGALAAVALALIIPRVFPWIDATLARLS